MLLVLLVVASKSQSWHKDLKIAAGNIAVPHERNIIWKTTSGFADSVCNNWANKTITDKMMTGKGNAPRIILAKLYAQKDIAGANQWLVKTRCGAFPDLLGR